MIIPQHIELCVHVLIGSVFCSFRLTDSVKQYLDKEEDNTGTLSYKQWREFVDDLWNLDKLANLREGGEEEEEEEKEEVEKEEERAPDLLCTSHSFTLPSHAGSTQIDPGLVFGFGIEEEMEDDDSSLSGVSLFELADDTSKNNKHLSKEGWSYGDQSITSS